MTQTDKKDIFVFKCECIFALLCMFCFSYCSLNWLGDSWMSEWGMGEFLCVHANVYVWMFS